MTTTTLVQAGTNTSTVQVAGFITVDISGTPYTLSGTVGDAIIVDYHRSFAEGANLGSIVDIAGSVGHALGYDDLGKVATDAATALTNVPFLKPLSAALLTANVRITDLAINTATSTYQFGFGLDLTGQGLAIASVALDSFGIVVTSTKPKPNP